MLSPLMNESVIWRVIRFHDSDNYLSSSSASFNTKSYIMLIRKNIYVYSASELKYDCNNFRWMEVYPEKRRTPHHAVYRPFVRGIHVPPSTEKLLQCLLIILLKAHYKCIQFSLTLTLVAALLLTLLTTYFRYGGWRYTPFVSTNQNHCYMPKLNDLTGLKIKCICETGTSPAVTVVNS